MRTLAALFLLAASITSFSQDIDGSLSTQSTNEIRNKVYSPNRADDFNQDMIGGKMSRVERVSSSGTNTYTASGNAAITSYQNGWVLFLKIGSASTNSSTLNFNTIGSKKIFKTPTVQAGSGDLQQNQSYALTYDTSLDSGAGGFLIMGSPAVWGSITGSIGNQTDLQDSLSSKRDLKTKLKTFTADHTLALADAERIIFMNMASANTLTIPTHASVALPLYTTIWVSQVGAGLTSVNASVGVSIDASSGSFDSPGQGTLMLLYQWSIDSWKLYNGTVILPIDLTTDVTGVLPYPNGGTGLSTLGTTGQSIRVNAGGTEYEFYTPSTGSVTSVTSADGNATVANTTTTPVITIVSAPKLQTARTLSITGDLSYTSPSFDGTGNVTAAGTLATVNSNVGTFGGSASNLQVTVNGKGLITAAASVTPQRGEADGSTRGVLALNANDFDAASGIANIDYANGQKASSSFPGFLSSTDWTTFNNKSLRLQQKVVSTTTYTVVNGDENYLIHLTSSTGCTVTLPAGVTTDKAVNFRRATGGGTITFTNDGTSTLTATAFTIEIDEGWATWVKDGSTTWHGIGSLGASGGAGTVTSVGLSLGSSGTDVGVTGSPVTSSGSFTLNIPTASASNRGVLSSTDWSNFNNKQSAITFGTGVQTALGVNIGSAGAPMLFNGAAGTPTSLTLTNATGLTVAGGGTGQSSLTAYAPLFGGTTSTGAIQSGTVGTSGQVLTSNGAGALPTFQTIPAGFTNPMTTAGDIIYGASGGTATRLATATGFLKGGTTPSYSAINLASSDVTGTLAVAKGGTGTTTSTGTGNMVLSSAPTLTDPVVGTQTSGDNTAKAASTAFVQAAISGTAVMFFGDGTDGDLTVTTNNATSGPILSGALTRDAYFNNLTISGSGSIRTDGYRLFVKGTLDITAAGVGALTVDGRAAGNGAAGGTGGVASAAVVAGSVGGAPVARNGGAGSTTTGGSATASISANISNGGVGGTGQTGGSGSGGSGGASAIGGTILKTALIARYTDQLLLGPDLLVGGTAGGGGGAGGGDVVNSGAGGGSGGSGGGVLAIWARTINRGGSTAAGSLTAKGSAGGNGGTTSTGNTGGGAGGGGGGGGWAYIFYFSLSGSTATNCIDVSGGAGGAGGNGTGTGGGGRGGNGGSGGRIDVINGGSQSGTHTFGSAGSTSSTASGSTGSAGAAGNTQQGNL